MRNVSAVIELKDVEMYWRGGDGLISTVCVVSDLTLTELVKVSSMSQHKSKSHGRFSACGCLRDIFSRVGGGSAFL